MTLRTWIRVAGAVAALGLAQVVGCGSEFTAASDAGVPGGPGAACLGPEDCNDSDPCTLDQCGADSRCSHMPKCDGAEQCCEGACAACCQSSDCDDGIACTTDQCFAGGCTHVPDDGKCDATSYCSPTQGCRPRVPCPTGDVAICDDENPCTTESCVEALCWHAFCEAGSRCCPDVGCAECCNHTECNDGDPCTQDICVEGQCQSVAKCAEGTKCCASPDGTTATCGSECCSASECADSVACTIDACAAGTCSHTPGTCSTPGQVCDPVAGCVTPTECSGDTDCNDGNPCTTDKCSSGKCSYTGCSDLRCCSGVGCRACCQASDCTSGSSCTVAKCEGGTCSYLADNTKCSPGQVCDPVKGCIQCTSAGDCNDGNKCTTDSCVNNKCVHSQTLCLTGYCCPDTGACAECCADRDCQYIALETQAPVPICSNAICSNGLCLYSSGCGIGQKCCDSYCVAEWEPCPIYQ